MSEFIQNVGAGIGIASGLDAVFDLFKPQSNLDPYGKEYFQKAYTLAMENANISSNFYQINIMPNFQVNANWSRGFENIPLICDQAEIPGKFLSTASQKTYGPLQKFPTLTVFNDITLSFICLGDDMYPRGIFEDWINSINPKDKYDFKYKDTYMSEIHIQQMNKAGTIVYDVKLFDAFPIAIHNQKLNFSSVEFQTLQVTFTFTDIDYDIKNRNIRIAKQIDNQVKNITVDASGRTLDENFANDYQQLVKPSSKPTELIKSDGGMSEFTSSSSDTWGSTITYK